jgi:hypothetical protein
MARRVAVPGDTAERDARGWLMKAYVFSGTTSDQAWRVDRSRRVRAQLRRLLKRADLAQAVVEARELLEGEGLVELVEVLDRAS